MVNILSALQQAKNSVGSNANNYILNAKNILGGLLNKNKNKTQPVKNNITNNRPAIFEEATKYFTPEAKARAANVPIQYQIMTDYPEMPTKLEHSGLLWDKKDSPLGMYMSNSINPAEARIFMRPNLENAPQVLRHELIHSMDQNINMPKMSMNQSLNGQERRVVDPVGSQNVLFNNILKRAYLLNSQGISSNFSNEDKDFLNQWNPSYSMKDTEALAFLNDQPSSNKQLQPYYQNAIQYPPGHSGPVAGKVVPNSGGQRLQLKKIIGNPKKKK